MEASKKSRKWRFRKGPFYAGHSSKYQKDYQNNGHEPVKTHGYTAYQHNTTQHSTYPHIRTQHIVHSSTQHTSTQVWHSVATKATAWPTVTHGGHSVSVQNRTNLPNRADNGVSRVPEGPLPLILNRNL